MKTKRYLKPFLSVLGLCALVVSLSSCGVQDIPRQNNQVEAAWAEVVNQYKRRADLVPSLVETVKGYAKHEKETLESVMRARASATQVNVDPKDLSEAKVREFMQAQQGLGGALSRLMVVAERYPDLKANQNFRDLQVQLEGTENRITVARNRYIEDVKTFNNYVTVFPTNLTNKILYKFEKKPQFTVENEAEVARPPEVKF